MIYITYDKQKNTKAFILQMIKNMGIPQKEIIIKDDENFIGIMNAEEYFEKYFDVKE